MNTSPKFFNLFILLFLYFLIRIPLLLSPLESVFTHGPLEELLVNGDGEGVIAGIAHFFIQGSKLPFWDFTAEPYGLGSLVAAFWLVPFFKLLGETIFAFKLAPVCWHLFSLVAWYWVWSSFYSRRRAFFISLFFVLPPPLIMEYSLTDLGSHFEMILLTAFNILLFKKVLEKRISEIWGGLLLGLLGGLSSAYLFTHFITVGVILIYMGFYKGLPLRKSVFYGAYFAGLCLGFAPWIFANYGSDWMSFYFVYHHFLGGNVQGLPILVRWSLPTFFGFRKFPNPVGPLLGIVFSGIYLYSLVYLGWRLMKRRQAPMIESFGFFYQILFLILLVFTARIENRYLFPIIPFMGMTLVLALEPLKQKWKCVMTGFWVGVSLWGNLGLIQWREMGKTLVTSAHSEYYGVAGSFQDKFGHDPNLLFEKVRLFLSDKDLDWQQHFYEVLKSNQSNEELNELLEKR